MNNVYIISMGCDKNRVDGEVMVGSLRHAGYNVINEPSQAQVIIVNTCGFISEAVQESIDLILELADYKKAAMPLCGGLGAAPPPCDGNCDSNFLANKKAATPLCGGFDRGATPPPCDGNCDSNFLANKTNGVCKALIVVGCMAARYKDEIATAIPEADEIVGVGEYENISSLVKKYLPLPSDDSSIKWQNPNSFLLRMYAREDDITPHIAYIKISEGCDNRCTYCTIPLIRGGYKSRLVEDILVECEQLYNLGAREFVLVAQDTALYGMDIYGRKALPELIIKIAEIAKTDKNIWIRLMYIYPEHITPELITAMQLSQVCKYIDMPIQHSETSILAQMGRKGSREELINLIQTLRNQIPNISIRTTLMVGFPGETDSDFKNMLQFVKKIKFDRLGAFPYSQEEGTPAATFPQQVDSEIKSDRLNELMELQQEIHFKNQESKIGKTEQVIIDSSISSENEEDNDEDDDLSNYIGRTQYDTYDVDTIVYVHSKIPLTIGQFYNVCITGVNQYDLIGEILENEPS